MTALIEYGIRNLWTRKFTTVLTAGGMALTAAVFSAVLMLAEGLEQTLAETGSPQNAIVLRTGSETEVSSIITREEGAIIESRPEIEQTAMGLPMAAKESIVLITLPKRGSNQPTNVVVRGVDDKSPALRPQVRLKWGRMFRPGSREIIVGTALSSRLRDMKLGDTVSFALADWKVVGIFDAGTTAFNSEIWGNREQLMGVFRRPAYSAVIARVPGKDAFVAFQEALEGDPRLTVDVLRETEFYRKQSELMANFIRILGLVMTVFFSVGAVLGAMVTMYTAVANRTREIGTLRALGFSRASILFAFLAESLFLGFIGGTAGTALSSLLQLLTISTLNWETFSELAFGFKLTPTIAAYSLMFACAMGLVGGFLPARRAARLAIVDSLRAA